jgi:hypothetical protein
MADWMARGARCTTLLLGHPFWLYWRTKPVLPLQAWQCHYEVVFGHPVAGALCVQFPERSGCVIGSQSTLQDETQLWSRLTHTTAVCALFLNFSDVQIVVLYSKLLSVAICADRGGPARANNVKRTGPLKDWRTYNSLLQPLSSVTVF